jgi:capping protein alpha
LTTETPKAINVTGAGNDAKTMAAATAKAIERCEQDFHSELEKIYNTMGDTTFKALRRVLPITRQKIDWTKIQNYKVDVGGKRGK